MGYIYIMENTNTVQISAVSPLLEEINTNPEFKDNITEILATVRDLNDKYVKLEQRTNSDSTEQVDPVLIPNPEADTNPETETDPATGGKKSRKRRSRKVSKGGKK